MRDRAKELDSLISSAKDSLQRESRELTEAVKKAEQLSPSRISAIETPFLSFESEKEKANSTAVPYRKKHKALRSTPFPVKKTSRADDPSCRKTAAQSEEPKQSCAEVAQPEAKLVEIDLQEMEEEQDDLELQIYEEGAAAPEGEQCKLHTTQPHTLHTPRRAENDEGEEVDDAGAQERVRVGDEDEDNFGVEEDAEEEIETDDEEVPDQADELTWTDIEEIAHRQPGVDLEEFERACGMFQPHMRSRPREDFSNPERRLRERFGTSHFGTTAGSDSGPSPPKAAGLVGRTTRPTPPPDSPPNEVPRAGKAPAKAPPPTMAEYEGNTPKSKAAPPSKAKAEATTKARAAERARDGTGCLPAEGYNYPLARPGLTSAASSKAASKAPGVPRHTASSAGEMASYPRARALDLRMQTEWERWMSIPYNQGMEAHSFVKNARRILAFVKKLPRRKLKMEIKICLTDQVAAAAAAVDEAKVVMTPAMEATAATQRQMNQSGRDRKRLLPVAPGRLRPSSVLLCLSLELEAIQNDHSVARILGQQRP